MSVDINALVEHYIKLRDHLSLLEAQHKAACAEVKAQMANAEGFLLEHMNQAGASNLGVSAGTIMVQVKTMPGLKDKGSFLDFVRQTGQVELLQARVSSTAVKEYMDAHNNEVPPGVEITTERTISIRRK